MIDMELLDWPRTVDQAVERLLSILNDEQKEDIASRSKADLIELHFSLGQNIRNAFGLWSDNRELLTDCQKRSSRFLGDHDPNPVPYIAIHPDDASIVILEALWDGLHH